MCRQHTTTLLWAEVNQEVDHDHATIRAAAAVQLQVARAAGLHAFRAAAKTARAVLLLGPDLGPLLALPVPPLPLLPPLLVPLLPILVLPVLLRRAAPTNDRALALHKHTLRNTQQ